MSKNYTQNHINEHSKEHHHCLMHHEAHDLVQCRSHLHKPLLVLHLGDYSPQLLDNKFRVSNQNWPVRNCRYVNLLIHIAIASTRNNKT